MPRELGDPRSRYFRDVYPALRGTGPFRPAAWLTRAVTEPGRRERVRWVLDQIGAGPPRRVLDLGCGEGTFAVALAGRGHRVDAVDVSPAMVEATRRAAERAGVGNAVRCAVGDARTWRPGASYDVVLCIGVAEYYEEGDGLLQELFGRAASALLFTLTRREPGARAALRSAWLGAHGIRPRRHDRAALDALLSRFPGATVTVREAGSTFCVRVTRPVPRVDRRGANA